ncbi:MAG: glycosyltransferase [Spirochaetales bacterium]|nr:glycosyltransferase [Spirochaetales bacterium]
MNLQKVLIAHYRVGWTDGVSLEIDKRKTILEEMGFQVILLAGSGSRGANYIIDELDFERNEIKCIAAGSFINSSQNCNKKVDEQELSARIEEIASIIEEKLFEVIQREQPVFIFTHNIFSHGRHIAAAKAFASILKKTGIKSLTTHHDFYWERDDFKTPSCFWVQNYLNDYVPPRLPGMKHAVINSIAAKRLEAERGIVPFIFPDTLNFSQPVWKKDEYNSSFLNDFDLREDDIIILQATRIVRRKGIELVPPVIKALNSNNFLEKLRGSQLYNGKTVTEASRVVFVLAGYAEHEAEPYRLQLEKQMEELCIEYRFLYPWIGSDRKEVKGRKVYSLFDTYPYADFISYPSLYEGWGNQFLEAVFSKTPIMIYEYPVYKADIKEAGYRVVSMGSSAERGENGLYSMPFKDIERCAEEVFSWLIDEKTNERLVSNFMIAEKNNSYKALRRLIKEGMKHYADL